MTARVHEGAEGARCTTPYARTGERGQVLHLLHLAAPSERITATNPTLVVTVNHDLDCPFLNNTLPKGHR